MSHPRIPYINELRSHAQDTHHQQSVEESPYNQDHKESHLGRANFISPECVYSNEQRKLFEKIGYQKSSQGTSSAHKQKPLAQSQERKVDKSIDNRIFIRRRNKVDDSFYEKRLNTLSKTRPRKTQDLDEASTSQNGSAMKRLIAIRKAKQMRATDTPIELDLNDEQTLDYHPQYNSRTANDTVIEDQCSSIIYTDTIMNQNIHQSIINDNIPCSKQAGSTSSRWMLQSSFMSRRQLRDLKNKNGNAIANSMNRKASSGWNDFSQDIHQQQNNSGLLISNDFDDSHNTTDHRSIGSSQTFRGIKRIQLNKVVNQANYLQFVPQIKGITKQQLLELFQARCKDLRINPSKDQMTKYFEILVKNRSNKERKLNLNDMGLGNHSIQVLCTIIKNNPQFSSLDLRKNFITNEGITALAKCLVQNTSIVHLDVGCNQISAEGAIELFKNLKYNQSLVSLSLANTDCYKNKNKIGLKGAIALSELLQQNHMIQFLNFADNSISSEGLHYIITGAKDNPHLVSLNLSQNDIGSGTTAFNNILSMFQQSTIYPDKIACTSLEELVISNNSLSNKNIEDLAHCIKTCSKSQLQRLDLSYNKLTAKSLLTIIQALRSNPKMKLTHLYMDRTSLEMGSHQEQVNNFYHMLRVLTEYLRSNKTLQVLSLNHCSLNNEVMNAIGKGLQNNERLEVLNVKQNQIYSEGLIEIIEAFENNQLLKLKALDISSNKINNEGGQILAGAFAKVESLEQVNLRDNNIGMEAGDAFLFLVQQKRNLWRLQLDMNMIKYVTLLDIEKICKRNKRNAKFYVNLPDFKQQINKLQVNKDPSVRYDEMDKQIQHQSKVIKEGQKYVIEEEDVVHEIINQGHQDLKQYDHQRKRLTQKHSKLDDVISKLDAIILAKEKEWQRKISHEENLLERCREYIITSRKAVDTERQHLKHKKLQRKVNDEELKLRAELEKVTREQDMMKMIVDNYEKEINRRKGTLKDEENAQAREALGLMGLKSMNLTIDNEKQEKKTARDKSEAGTTKNQKKKGKAPSRKKSSNKKIKMINTLMTKQGNEQVK